MREKKFEYFLSIVESGSITKAAKKNYIAQPSMTQYLNRLEESVGIELFNREKSPFQLTAAGEVYLEYVKKRQELDRELEEKINKLKKEIHGEITVGIPLQMQSPLVHDLIPPFLDRYPNINIAIRDETSPALEKAVQNGRMDCALIYIQNPGYPKLSYSILEKERLCVICSRDNSIAKGQESSVENPISVTLEQLQNMTFCLMDKNFIVRMISDDFFTQHDFAPKRTLTMSSMHALLNTVCSSEGIAFIPEYEVKKFSKYDQIAWLEIEQEPLFMNLALVSQKEKYLSQTVQAFSSFVKEKYQI